MLPDMMKDSKVRDFQLRSTAIENNRIVRPELPPRRVWDLYANRVLPFYALSPLPAHWTLPRKLWAVSHSWVAPSDRQYVLTAVNGRAWHVPIPRGATLDSIRDELLLLGAEYVFLDVLCLRQKDDLFPQFEGVRKREWRLDVPTIGHVYNTKDVRPVIVYFNGLGLPFRDGGTNEGDKFHWFNRVWTTQEWPMYIIPGGLDHTVGAIGRWKVFAETDEPPRWASAEFFRHFVSIGEKLRGKSVHLDGYLKVLQTRFCANPIDQVSCLAYLLRCPTLPIYDADMEVEVAWSLLMECLPREELTSLLVSDFDPTIRPTDMWQPTWKQLNSNAIFRYPFDTTLHAVDAHHVAHRRDPLLEYLDGSSPDAGFRYGYDAYYNKAFVIQGCKFSFDDNLNSLVEVPFGAGSETKSYRISMSRRVTSIGHNTAYLLINFTGGIYWLIARQEGIRWIKNENAIEVSKVSVATFRDEVQFSSPPVDREGCLMPIVYR